MAFRLFRFRSIKRQIVGFGVLLIIFTSLLISAVYTAILWHSLKTQQISSMERMMTTRTQWIDQWFEDRMKTVRKLAALASVREHDIATMNRDFKALNDLDPYIANIGFLTTEGRLEVTTSGQGGLNLSDRGYFQEAIKGKEHISEIIVGRASLKEPIIVFAAPVYGDNGQIIGVLQASAKMTTINDVMRTMRFGKSGEIYLVDAQGFMLTETRFPDEALARNSVTSAIKVDTFGFRQAQNGQNGIESYEDYRGKKVVGAFQWLPEKNWAIIAEINEDELVGYILDDLGLNFLVVLVILLLSLPVAFIFSRHITKPIIELSSGVKQLREGDYKYRIPVSYTPIYAQSEFHELCDTFNHMAETIEQNNTQLETRVNERTAALAREAAEHQRMQERYEILFNSVNDAVFVYPITEDKPGRFLEVNDVACLSLGYSKEELLHFSLPDISNHPDLESQKAFEALIHEGSTLVESSYRTRNAEEIPVEVNSRIFKLGDELLAISTARDITERLRMQQALRRQVALEKLVAQISTRLANSRITATDKSIRAALAEIGLFVDASVSFFYSNNPENEHFGLKHFWLRDKTHFRDYAKFRKINLKSAAIRSKLLGLEHVYLSLAQMQSLGFDTSELTAKNIKSVVLMPVVQDNLLAGLFGVAVDYDIAAVKEDVISLLQVVSELISNSLEKQSMFRQICASEARNKALVDSVPDTMIHLSRRGDVLSAKFNTKRYPVFYFEPDNITGKNIHDILPESLAQKFDAAITQALAYNDVYSVEYDLPINNTVYYREARVIACGETEVLLVIRDTTAHRQAQQEAENARAVIAKAQRMASLGIMAGNISHEINQPLSTIKIAASGLAYFQEANIPVAKEYLSQELERIVQETDRINRIIMKTRKLVRMDTTATAPLIAVNDAIDSAIALVEDQQIFNGIQIRRNLSPVATWIACDMHQLEQVIVNLLNNAAQALCSVNRGDKVITVSSSLDDSKTHITVSDNGPGIDCDSFQRIFEPFFSTNTHKDNMGLGLTIVQSIVSAYRGEVAAGNNPDGGASFSLTFPAAKPTE